MLVLLICAATLAFVAMMAWPPINAVETGATPEYPQLRPQVLRYSPTVVLARAVETVEELDRWQLVEVDAQAGQVRSEATTHLGFVDDVVITVEPFGAGSLVGVRSMSRTGRGDFGQNARNIETFQERLQVNLSLARQVR